MEELHETFDLLRLHITRATKQFRIIRNITFNLPIKKESFEKVRLLLHNNGVISIYERADGFVFEYQAKENASVSGQMKFLELKYVFQDWMKAGLFTKSDLQQNDLLEFYRPMDFISETMSCGLIITPDFTSESMYLHNAPEPELYDLNLNFYGYIAMAQEARIFEYWPKVILDIKNETESPETRKFKEWMPKLFPDFSWEKFVEKYETLRLK